jgi:hypothetical protein
MSVRRERQLGWVTQNEQEFPTLSAVDWVDAIKHGLCPICGAGPFTVPAQHVRQAHDMNRYELRDLLGVTVATSICDPMHSKAISARGVEAAQRRDMRAMGQQRTGSKRLTNAAIAAAARTRKMRSCVVCGDVVADRRRTCSDECRKTRQAEAITLAVGAQRRKPPEMVAFSCPECGQMAERPAAQVRSNRKQGWAGPFCGMSCAGKYRQRTRYAVRPT